MSWAVMRTRLPSLRTEPSTRWVAFSAWPTERRFWFSPLNSNAEVRATTLRSGTLASAAVISSVIPSEEFLVCIAGEIEKGKHCYGDVACRVGRNGSFRDHSFRRA